MWEMWEMWVKWDNGERKEGLWSPAVTVWKRAGGLVGWWSVGECRVPGAEVTASGFAKGVYGVEVELAGSLLSWAGLDGFNLHVLYCKHI